MRTLALDVFGDFITVAIILSARRLFVIRLRRRYVDRPRKRKRSTGFHQTVLAEGLEPYPGGPRTWEVTCGHPDCSKRKIIKDTYAAAQNWSIAHEEDPKYAMFPPAAAVRKKGGKHHG